MGQKSSGLRARSAVVVAGLALAAGISACGGSDDERASDREQPAAAQDVRGGIQAALDRMKRDFVARDERGICGGLTERGRRETAESIAGGAPTCEQSATAVLDAYGDALHQEVTVLRVRREGDRATATLRSETGNTYPSRFARQDGVWRLDQSLIPDPE
ncbi:MAG: hypothetical protein WEB79_04200 [Thermoleophilaceae bacterium]